VVAEILGAHELPPGAIVAAVHFGPQDSAEWQPQSSIFQAILISRAIAPANRPVLVQLKLDRDFVNAIDNWRKSRSAPLPRTQAIVELASIGLADQALSSAKPKRKRRP
jgi:hypothetical protein